MASREKLIVFDFDWSLVEENSDTWVLQKLGALDIFKRLQSQGKAPLGILTAYIMTNMTFQYHVSAGVAREVQRRV